MPCDNATPFPGRSPADADPGGRGRQVVRTLRGRAGGSGRTDGVGTRSSGPGRPDEAVTSPAWLTSRSSTIPTARAPGRPPTPPTNWGSGWTSPLQAEGGAAHRRGAARPAGHPRGRAHRPRPEGRQLHETRPIRRRRPDPRAGGRGAGRPSRDDPAPGPRRRRRRRHRPPEGPGRPVPDIPLLRRRARRVPAEVGRAAPAPPRWRRSAVNSTCSWSAGRSWTSGRPGPRA